MTGLTYDQFSEKRAYNSLLQLTQETTSGPVTQGSSLYKDMRYTYTAGQNNGRIATSTDNVSGETVQYTYDSLNRLVSAQATSGSTWSQSYTYDGFGNMG